MNSKKITYFQYARKSSEGEDRQSLSIDGQLKDNQHIIQRHSLTVIDTITDEASAAVPFNRPGYKSMINRIKKGEASGIIVWHVDRLIRNPLEEGEFKWLLQTGVIKSIWTPSREYRSEDNALLFSIEASMAAQYSRDLSVKVRRGLKQKYEMGQPSHIAPLGYLNTKFSISGTNYITEDPDRFPILRKGFELMLTGIYTVPEIASILHKEYGLRPRPGRRSNGLTLGRNTLYRIFTNPFYYGSFRRKDILYTGTYKPMITVHEFDQIQRILGRGSSPRKKSHSFAFTGLIKCGSCGCAITATEKIKWIKKTGELKIYIFYHCTKRKKGCEACPEKHYTKEDVLEKMIVTELEKYNIKLTFKDWAINYFNRTNRDEIEKRKQLLQSITQEENKLLQEMDILLDLRIANSVNEEKFQEKKAEKEQLLIRVRAKRDGYSNGSIDRMEILASCLDFATGTVEAFKNGSGLTKKQICKEFGWNWTLKGEKLFIDKKKWLEPIKNMKEICESNLERLEPEKSLEKPDYNSILHIISPLLSELLIDVGNISP